jgi:hypothetical protein
MRYNGRIRTPGEPISEPDTFPLRMKNAPRGVLATTPRVSTLGLFDVP